jgi:hypothetical protein
MASVVQQGASQQNFAPSISAIAKVHREIIVKNLAARNGVSEKNLLGKARTNPNLQPSALDKFTVAVRGFFATISCFLLLSREEEKFSFLLGEEETTGKSKWERAHSIAMEKLTTGAIEGQMKEIVFVPLTAEKLKKNNILADNEKRRNEIATAMQKAGICDDGDVDACIMAMKCAIESNFVNREWEGAASAPGQAQDKNEGQGFPFMAATLSRNAKSHMMISKRFLDAAKSKINDRNLINYRSINYGNAIDDEWQSTVYTICGASDDDLIRIIESGLYTYENNSELNSAAKALAEAEQKRRKLTTMLIPFLVSAGIIYNNDIPLSPFW